MDPALIDIIMAESEACRLSSQNHGEYNAAFFVASVVLASLATRLRDATNDTVEA